MGILCNTPESKQLVTATTIVFRLQWQSRHFCTLISPGLLRDALLHKRLPGECTNLQLRLFARQTVFYEIVTALPRLACAQLAHVCTEVTTVFLIPPLAPSLTGLHVRPPAISHMPEMRLAPLLHVALHAHALLDEHGLTAARAILVQSASTGGAIRCAARAVHSDNAQLVAIQPMHILPHAVSTRALCTLLRHFAACAMAMAPAVLLLDDVQVLFPPDDAAACAILPDVVSLLREASPPVVLLLCTPYVHAVHAFVTTVVDSAITLPAVAPLRATHACVAGVAARAGMDGRRALSADELTERWAGVARELGGLSRVLRVLQRALVWPRTRGGAMRHVGVRAARGVLLYGVPGTGKTALVSACARACAMGVVRVDAAMIAHGQVGTSEARLVDAFRTAVSQTPCVLFVDEVDSLFGRGDGAATGRLVSVLAACLDSVVEGVVVIAATNRPWGVAARLLQPGRFDCVELVGLPDGGARIEIAQVFARKLALHATVADCLLALVGGESGRGLSGADIGGLCRRAVMSALWFGRRVCENDFVLAFRTLVRSVGERDARAIADWRARDGVCE